MTKREQLEHARRVVDELKAEDRQHGVNPADKAAEDAVIDPRAALASAATPDVKGADKLSPNSATPDAEPAKEATIPLEVYERLRFREPTKAEGEEALGEKDETFLSPWTVRRCRHCADPVFGGPTACLPCVVRNEARAAAFEEAAKEAEIFLHILTPGEECEASPAAYSNGTVRRIATKIRTLSSAPKAETGKHPDPCRNCEDGGHPSFCSPEAPEPPRCGAAIVKTPRGTWRCDNAVPCREHPKPAPETPEPREEERRGVPGDSASQVLASSGAALPPQNVHPSNLTTVIDVLETEREEIRADRDKWKRYAHTSAAGFSDAVSRIDRARDNIHAAIDAFDAGDGDALDEAHGAALDALCVPAALNLRTDRDRWRDQWKEAQEQVAALSMLADDARTERDDLRAERDALLRGLRKLFDHEQRWARDGRDPSWRYEDELEIRALLGDSPTPAAEGDGPRFTEEGARHRIETLVSERAGVDREYAILRSKLEREERLCAMWRMAAETYPPLVAFLEKENLDLRTRLALTRESREREAKGGSGAPQP